MVIARQLSMLEGVLHGPDAASRARERRAHLAPAWFLAGCAGHHVRLPGDGRGAMGWGARVGWPGSSGTIAREPPRQSRHREFMLAWTTPAQPREGGG